jgi:hypothetical protein
MRAQVRPMPGRLRRRRIVYILSLPFYNKSMNSLNKKLDPADKRIKCNYLSSLGAFFVLIGMWFRSGFFRTSYVPHDCHQTFLNGVWTENHCELAIGTPPALVVVSNVLFIMAVLLVNFGLISAICSIFWLRKNQTTKKSSLVTSIVVSFISVVIAAILGFIVSWNIAMAL